MPQSWLRLQRKCRNYSNLPLARRPPVRRGNDPPTYKDVGGRQNLIVFFSLGSNYLRLDVRRDERINRYDASCAGGRSVGAVLLMKREGWLGNKDSNLDWRNQNPQSCRWTIPQSGLAAAKRRIYPRIMPELAVVFNRRVNSRLPQLASPKGQDYL